MRSETIMEHKGYKARIMEAERLTGDHVHGLPPGTPLPAYPSDMFLNFPKNWIKNSYVVPVRPNKGLWFDWTLCDAANTAILPTVKGCNPITGMQTSGFHLERYDTKCPKHGCDFMADRYCPECDYKWPFGNYVANPNTLWFDGFLNCKDGSVRQFFFTEEEMRDIATHLIGKDQTVPAFGFAFYRPKELRQPQVPLYRGAFKSSPINDDFLWIDSDSTGDPWKGMPQIYCDSVLNENSTSGTLSIQNASGDPTSSVYLCAAASAAAPTKSACYAASADHTEVRGVALLKRLQASKSFSTPVKEVSVGAGAKINQNLIPDPYPLDSWCDTPAAVMTIYFVFQEKLEELIAGGVRDLEGKPEGMLAGLPVG